MGVQLGKHQVVRMRLVGKHVHVVLQRGKREGAHEVDVVDNEGAQQLVEVPSLDRHEGGVGVDDDEEDDDGGRDGDEERGHATVVSTQAEPQVWVRMQTTWLSPHKTMFVCYWAKSLPNNIDVESVEELGVVH